MLSLLLFHTLKIKYQNEKGKKKKQTSDLKPHLKE